LAMLAFRSFSRRASSPIFRTGSTGLEVTEFWLSSLTLGFAFFLSLMVPHFFPVILYADGPRVPIAWNDYGKIWYFFLPFFFAWGFETWDGSQHRDRILRLWQGGLFFLCALGLQQVFTGWPHLQAVPGSNNLFHATLLYGHHLSTSSLFGLVVPLLLFSPSRLSKGLGALATLVLIFSFSRMAWIALPVCGVAWFLLKRLSMKRIILGLGSLALLVFALYHVPFIYHRYLETYGSSTRFGLWRLNFEWFLDHPVTGIGLRKTIWAAAEWTRQFPGSIPEGFSGHAHNNVLDLLSGTGFVGTLSYLGWSTIPLLSCFKRMKENTVDAWRFEGIFWGLILFHFQGLTQVNALEGKVQTGLAFLLGYWIYLTVLRPQTLKQGAM
jgi:O-antigen ligase